MRYPGLLIGLRFLGGRLCIFLVTVTYYALDDLHGHRLPSGKTRFSYDSIVLKKLREHDSKEVSTDTPYRIQDFFDCINLMAEWRRDRGDVTRVRRSLDLCMLRTRDMWLFLGIKGGLGTGGNSFPTRRGRRCSGRRRARRWLLEWCGIIWLQVASSLARQAIQHCHVTGQSSNIMPNMTVHALATLFHL